MNRTNRDSPLDYLIVGGGIHGVHVALRLLADGGVRRERLRIIDPGERLLDRWRTCTQVTGMTHLRSPVVHNIGRTANCLARFAGKRKERPLGLFAAPYRRPSLSLFNAHCDRLLDTTRLEELHTRDRVSAASVQDDRVSLRLSRGSQVAARRVILALGSSEQPHWPSWASSRGPLLDHVFAPGFQGWPSRDEPEEVAVIGGGISAAQVAIRLGSEGHKAHLVSRHSLREHQFDSDPGWLGPKYMRSFQLTQDRTVRRAMIEEARHRGSLSPDVMRALSRSRGRGEVDWHEAEIEGLTQHEAGLQLRLSSGNHLVVDRVLLATGYTPKRPGGALVDDLIETSLLPQAACGYPVLDSALRWHPRIQVTGPLAELELGPSARTIAGARHAGERILDSVREERASRVRASAS